MHKIHQTVIFARTLVFLVFLAVSSPSPALALPVKNLAINGTSFMVEVANRKRDMEKGLMYRRTLQPNRGMLFIYPEEQIIIMWMKNTYIPLDMIFINKEGTIVHIVRNTVPESLDSIESKVPAKAVLEIGAGIAKKRDIKVGDKVYYAAFNNTRP